MEKKTRSQILEVKQELEQVRDNLFFVKSGIEKENSGDRAVDNALYLLIEKMDAIDEKLEALTVALA